jgi:hypothetical protein
MQSAVGDTFAFLLGQNMKLLDDSNSAYQNFEDLGDQQLPVFDAEATNRYDRGHNNDDARSR